MGYFGSSIQGESYHGFFCSRCIHEEGCPVWAAHLKCNYEEGNKPESILHMLIPRSKEGKNEQCKMFIEK
jgi:hypothetical protein